MGLKKGQSNGIKFGEGQDPTRGGRPKLTEIEKSVRSATREQLATAIAKFQEMSLEDLSVFIEDKTNLIFELGIASSYMECIKTGDFTKIDKIYDRTLGKSATIVEHKGLDESGIRNNSVLAFADAHGLVNRDSSSDAEPKGKDKK